MSINFDKVIDRINKGARKIDYPLLCGEPKDTIQMWIADMDFEAARARGYVKATEKKEVYLKAAKRQTSPQTVYVKQKLDRDDIIDITDFDIVAMVRYELRTLLNEELARAAMIGDGRGLEDPYKINEENIRPIWKEDDLYAIKEKLVSESDPSGDEQRKVHKEDHESQIYPSEVGHDHGQAGNASGRDIVGVQEHRQPDGVDKASNGDKQELLDEYKCLFSFVH